MATKKQKRIKALAKREAFLAEEKRRGLLAQKQSKKSVFIEGPRGNFE